MSSPRLTATNKLLSTRRAAQLSEAKKRNSELNERHKRALAEQEAYILAEGCEIVQDTRCSVKQ